MLNLRLLTLHRRRFSSTTLIRQRRRSILGIRANRARWPDRRAEARKCVLLCANCHAEVEAGVVDVAA